MTGDMRRAELATDVAQAEAERDWYDEFLEVLRPWMEQSGRTLAEAFEAMPDDERNRAVELGRLAGVLDA